MHPPRPASRPGHRQADAPFSDGLLVLQGEFPCKASPFILGHEFSGVATDIGTGVSHITRGDRVVVDPNK